MRNKWISLAAVLPLSVPSLVLAQEAAAGGAPGTAVIVVTGDDSADYSLKAGAAGGPAAAGTPPVYNLTGTGFSGLHRVDDFIMTALLPVRGAPIKTEGGIFIYPSVFVGLGHNDNLLGSQANQIKSSFVDVSPEIVAEMKNRGDRYTAAFSANAMEYDSSRNDNFVNHELRFAGDNYFSQRARMGWSIGHLGGIDPRGSTQRPTSDHPDRWSAPIAEGRFIYGTPSSSGRFEFDANYISKRYDNNRSYTELADVDRAEVVGRFFYRIGARSHALIEVRDAEIDYRSAFSTDDSTERRYYVGLTWEATAATTGSIKVGKMTKDFKQAGRDGFSGGSWEAAIRWMPLTYSAFDLSTSRATADPTGYGSYIINTGTTLGWSHKWTSYVGSRVGFGSLRSQYVNTERVDTTRTWGAAVTYDVLRWMTIGLDYSNVDRSSTDPTAKFRRNIVMFTINMTL